MPELLRAHLDLLLPAAPLAARDLEGLSTAGAVLYINLILSTQGKPQIVYVLYFLGFSANVALAIWGGQKFLSYRMKYDRLYQIQKNLE